MRTRPAEMKTHRRPVSSVHAGWRNPRSLTDSPVDPPVTTRLPSVENPTAWNPLHVPGQSTDPLSGGDIENLGLTIRVSRYDKRTVGRERHAQHLAPDAHPCTGLPDWQRSRYAPCRRHAPSRRVSRLERLQRTHPRTARAKTAAHFGCPRKRQSKKTETLALRRQAAVCHLQKNRQGIPEPRGQSLGGRHRVERRASISQGSHRSHRPRSSSRREKKRRFAYIIPQPWQRTGHRKIGGRAKTDAVVSIACCY